MTSTSPARRTPAALLIVLALLPGCGGCPQVKLKTLELQPTSRANGTDGFQGSMGWCLSAGKPPPTSFSPGAGRAMVGFDDFFDPGSDPYPCDDIRAVNFQAGILFDVSQFDSIVTADLLFDTVDSVVRTGGETIGTTTPTSHATTLGVGTQAFTSALPFDNDALLPAGPNLNIGVTSQVRDWVDGTRSNFGFVVAGPRGPISKSSPPKDNDAKVSWYSNFRLRVTYNPAQNPRAPQ
jgi:hypothetical protein